MVVGLIAYLALVPLLISTAFPQYATVKKYTSIEVCTDLAPGTPSKVFLPVSCISLGSTNKIGCVYNSPRYVTPSRATSDETKLCPLLTSGVDATGAKNPALAVLPVSENALRNILTISLIAAVAILYILVRVIRRRITQQSLTIPQATTKL
ncbi:MAG: hypothetical protein JWN26_730 [Candidatus Saccharibacteria bacterium]|nr:hypothetical protein [Candidatus Saccharibacteria bacterium]